jgi:redox-sensitive bicupin YhaK (pirin superfamily)
MKKIVAIRRNDAGHWVGDGFPVRSIFSYNEGAEAVSPFLLLDYAGPVEFGPTTKRRGVGEHPHRGFETVTIVYAGEVEHRDSTGGGGSISEGDVQWMTAGSGIVHEEFHGRHFAKQGGPFEMVQLWVNLPAAQKMTPPGYQSIVNAAIPKVTLAEGAGSVRVIAGSYVGGTGPSEGSVDGPAHTFSPINLWDMDLKAGHRVELSLPEGHTAALFVLSGGLVIGEGRIGKAELGLLEREGDAVTLEVLENSRVLFLGGEPLGEPIVGYGPFVMTSEEEIRQAVSDFQRGLMGQLAPATA